ncbi:unnamed protein product [Camellia sinensis]
MEPIGYVPVLVDEDIVLSDSFAILMYLEEKYPQHPLLPCDLQRRGIYYQAVNIVSSSMQALQNIGVLKYIGKKVPPDEKLVWVQYHIGKSFAGIVFRSDPRKFVKLKYESWTNNRLVTKCAICRIDCGLAKFPSCDIDFLMDTKAMDMNLLESLVTSTRDVNSDKMVSDLQLKASIRHNILLCVAHSIAEAQLMDNASFVLLDKTFDKFASLWMNMKVEVKTKEDHEARQFKFKPRAFKIENIMEIDISTLGGSLENEILSEWQELLSDEKVAEKRTVDGIAHGVISLTRRISDINGMAQEFPTLSNTTGLVDSVVYLVDVYDKERFAEAKKDLDALHKKEQQYSTLLTPDVLFFLKLMLIMVL